MTSECESAEAEAQLVAGVARGDESSFRLLYERFSKPLFSLLMKMLQNQDDAEEVLQTVFLHIWRRSETYNPELSSVFTWLVMITRGRAIDRLRTRQRHLAVVDRFAAEIPSGEPDVPAEAGDSDSRALISSALQRISVDQRQAIELAFFSGLSQVEISQRLSAPLGTVKARIRRGMVQLRDFLNRRL
jgi:RNA polymerase sigma-70 factor (ECF subfamily)